MAFGNTINCYVQDRHPGLLSPSGNVQIPKGQRFSKEALAGLDRFLAEVEQKNSPCLSSRNVAPKAMPIEEEALEAGCDPFKIGAYFNVAVGISLFAYGIFRVLPFICG